MSFQSLPIAGAAARSRASMPTGAAKREVMSGPDSGRVGLDLDTLGTRPHLPQLSRLLEYSPVVAPERLKSGGLCPISRSPRSRRPTLHPTATPLPSQFQTDVSEMALCLRDGRNPNQARCASALDGRKPPLAPGFQPRRGPRDSAVTLRRFCLQGQHYRSFAFPTSSL